MTEKIRAINNPLTIIAIFAGLAEVAGTVALAVVDVEIQKIFVWFVMLFPTLLVTAFFATLFCKPTALYAPSDYRDESLFMQTVYGSKTIAIAQDLGEIEGQLHAAKAKIEEEAKAAVTQTAEEERDRILSVVKEQMAGLDKTISAARDFANKAFESAAVSADAEYSASESYQELKMAILLFLQSNKKTMSPQETSKTLQVPIAAVLGMLHTLTKSGEVISVGSGLNAEYTVPVRVNFPTPK